MRKRFGNIQIEAWQKIPFSQTQRIIVLISSRNSFSIVLSLVGQITTKRYKPRNVMWLIHAPRAWTFRNRAFCQHTVFICFLWLSKSTPVFHLKSINVDRTCSFAVRSWKKYNNSNNNDWYCQLKEEALDRTMWRNRFGRGFGPVVWQIIMMMMMSEWATHILFPSELRSEAKETTELYYITPKQESGIDEVRSETEERFVDWA